MLARHCLKGYNQFRRSLAWQRIEHAYYEELELIESSGNIQLVLPGCLSIISLAISVHGLLSSCIAPASADHTVLQYSDTTLPANQSTVSSNHDLMYCGYTAHIQYLIDSWEKLVARTAIWSLQVADNVETNALVGIWRAYSDSDLAPAFIGPKFSVQETHQVPTLDTLPYGT